MRSGASRLPCAHPKSVSCFGMFPSRGGTSSAHPQAHPRAGICWMIFHVGRGAVPTWGGNEPQEGFPQEKRDQHFLQSSPWQFRAAKAENKVKYPKITNPFPVQWCLQGQGEKGKSQKGKILIFGNKNSVLNRANHPNPKTDSSCLNPNLEAEEKPLAQADTLIHLCHSAHHKPTSLSLLLPF